MDKFWMVYGNGKGAPTVKHHEQLAATQEAKRLAEKFPGTKFYVLETNFYAVAEQPVAILYTAVFS